MKSFVQAAILSGAAMIAFGAPVGSVSAQDIATEATPSVNSNASNDATQTEARSPQAVEPAAKLVEQVVDHMSCKGSPLQIQVWVENVAENVGLMTADLYRNDQEGFLKTSGRVAQVRFAARAPVTAFCMTAPEVGDYAIAVYHDENANMSFDKKAFGLPAEPFGISNNPKLRFAAP